MKRNNLTVFVVPHTHWDRAWYLPFERMRVKLLRMIDNLLVLLESRPEFRTFCLDGQTVILEDYLALRPGQRDRLAQLIRDKRLTVGPWYVLPDEFLVSGESLVRNLLVGTRMARAFGRCMTVGYLPDNFGHVSQMPQILNGFGIDNFLFMRGGGDIIDKSGGVFSWLAPDGQSRVLAIYEAAGGYWNLFAWGLTTDRIRFLVDTLHTLTPVPEVALTQVRNRIDQMKQSGFPGSVFLLSNGCDHLPAQPQVPDLVKYCNQRLPGARLIHGSFDAYVQALKKQKLRVPTFRGELHEGKYWNLLSGVFSARTYLKQANGRATVALERVAEPLAALAWVAGCPYPAHELMHAWKKLLRNQPHDDVCGCSADAVHEDDLSRARQVEELATGLAINAVRHLAESAVDTPDRAWIPGTPGILVANSLARSRSGWVHLPEVWMPGEQALQQGGLVTSDGRPVPGWWRMKEHEIAELAVWCPDVPAMGWRVLHLSPQQAPLSGVTINRPRLRLENEHLIVQAGDHGTVTVTDKASGRHWDRLGSFEDHADAGDSYDYSPLANAASPITSLTLPAKWSVVEQNGMLPALRVCQRLRLPESLDPGRRRRSRRLTTLEIFTTVSLQPGARQVNFDVEFTNTAQDHRLRMAFPTGCRTSLVRAASPFDLVERPAQVAPRPDYHQPPVQTKHCDGLVSLSMPGGGLALMTEGLHEYEAARERGKITLYITLLRAFGWLSRKDLATRKGHAGHALATPDGQALRVHRLRLAFRPHQGLVDEPALLAERDEFLARLVAVAAPAGKRRLPCHAGLFTLEPAALHVTAVKKAEDRNSLVVRFVNLGRNTVNARLTLGCDIRAAWLLRLDEQRGHAVAVSKRRTVNQACRSREIITLELAFDCR